MQMCVCVRICLKMEKVHEIELLSISRKITTQFRTESDEEKKYKILLCTSAIKNMIYSGVYHEYCFKITLNRISWRRMYLSGNYS